MSLKKVAATISLVAALAASSVAIVASSHQDDAAGPGSRDAQTNRSIWY